MRLQVHSGIGTGIGLASNTYKQVLSSGELTLRELIAWAAGRGFSWVEVRDPNVEMGRRECLEMIELADRLGVRLHYSWDNRDALEEDPQFLLGMRNAALFGQGTCCRVLVAPGVIPGQCGYTKEQMEKIIPVLRTYTEFAAELGIYLCFENAQEPLFGNDTDYYGMADLLEAVPGMCATLDAANATNAATRVNPTEAEILEYYRKYSDRIFYYHLKCTRGHKLLDTVEADGDFRVRELFRAFSSNPEMKICLEIPQQSCLKDMTSCVEQSLTVLEEIYE